jgi:hypothetical protein
MTVAANAQTRGNFPARGNNVAQGGTLPLPEGVNRVVSIDAHNYILAEEGTGTQRTYSAINIRHLYSGGIAKLFGGSSVSTDQFISPSAGGAGATGNNRRGGVNVRGTGNGFSGGNGFTGGTGFTGGSGITGGTGFSGGTTGGFGGFGGNVGGGNGGFGAFGMSGIAPVPNTIISAAMMPKNTPGEEEETER